MNRNELRKIIVGPMATVGTPFDENYEVDLGRMYEMIQWYVENGLVTGKAVIKVAAAMGEGPQLRDWEWQALLQTAVQAAGNKATIMCGLHYKDTIRQIEDANRAADLGAVAVQVSPPVHNGPTRTDVIRFYDDLANGSDIGIMIYNTGGMLGDLIQIDDYRTMVENDNVVAIKWSSPGHDYEDLFEFKDRVNIIDNTKNPVRNHKLGGHGFINWTSEIVPSFDLGIVEMMDAGLYDKAENEWNRVYGPLTEIMTKLGQRSGGQARMKKGLMKITGKDIGDSRPPSEPLTADELADLRQVFSSLGFEVV